LEVGIHIHNRTSTIPLRPYDAHHPSKADPTMPSSNLPTAEELRVTDALAEVEPAYADFEGKMYAGFLPSDNGGDRTGQMMFWLFEPDVQMHEQTLVLWLNGGPGCSSFNCGVLMEICTLLQRLLRVT
jgi:carboxypeptidase C (cathepsin A)